MKLIKQCVVCNQEIERIDVAPSTLGYPSDTPPELELGQQTDILCEPCKTEVEAAGVGIQAAIKSGKIQLMRDWIGRLKTAPKMYY